MNRCIKISWMTFGKNRDLFKSKTPMCLKREIKNQCAIPAVIYGCEIWKLTMQAVNLLRVAQRAMERSMLGITLRDRKKSTWMREKTKEKDMVQEVKQLEWRWATCS